MRFSPAAAALLLGGLAAAPQSTHVPHHDLSSSQARRMAIAVARHDRIDLRDTHIELNSMDLGTDFIPGYASFIVIRESNVQGPDETLRRYAVNRRSGEVWEMTLCTHYDFPELVQMRRSFALSAPGGSEITQESRQLGCSEQKSAR
jgi:type VI secretion system (T6SS) Tgi2-like immunity protein